MEIRSGIAAWVSRKEVPPGDHGRNGRKPAGLKCRLAGAVSVYYNGLATGGEGKGGRGFLALRTEAGSTMVRLSLGPFSCL
jgi:hypothetical protein